MPPPINSLHQQVTESLFFFLYTSLSFTSRFVRKFCLTLFIPSLLTPLLTESANFIHLKALVLFPSLLFSKCGLLPITLCLIAQAGEGGWSSAGLIKMLMPLKGNISLAERKQAGKKKCIIKHLPVSFCKSSSMSTHDFQMFRCSFQCVRHTI